MSATAEQASAMPRAQRLACAKLLLWTRTRVPPVLVRDLGWSYGLAWLWAWATTRARRIVLDRVVDRVLYGLFRLRVRVHARVLCRRGWHAWKTHAWLDGSTQTSCRWCEAPRDAVGT